MHRYERFADEVMGRVDIRQLAPLLACLSEQDLVAVLAGTSGSSHDARYRRNIIATELLNRSHARHRLIDQLGAPVGEVDLTVFTRAVSQALGAEMACLDEVDGDTFILHGKYNLPRATAGIDRCQQPEMALCQEVLRTGVTLAVGDLASDPLRCDLPAHRELGLRNYAGAPGADRDNRVACVLWVAGYAPREFSDEELLMLRRVAQRMAKEFEKGDHPHPMREEPPAPPRLDWEEPAPAPTVAPAARAPALSSGQP